MNPPMPDIPINDIQPLVEVPDYSIYLFGGVVGAGIVTAAALVLFVVKKFKSRLQSERHRQYAALESVDLSDPKRAAYAISRIGLRFAADNERTAKAYHNLFERLEPYKYAPEVEPIDAETIGYYRLYLEMIDV